MQRKFNVAGWVVAIIILSTGILWAAGFDAPLIVRNSSTGRELWRIDTNGRPVLSNTSPTTAQGVAQGFVTGAAQKEFPVLFKDSQGTAVVMPDTNYAIFVSVEESPGLVGAAEPTAIITKTAAGFTIQTDNNLATTHTLRWMAVRR